MSQQMRSLKPAPYTWEPRELTKGCLFLTHTQDPYELLGDSDGRRLDLNPGSGASRAGRASQGDHRASERKVPVLCEPQPRVPLYSFLLLDMTTVVLPAHNSELNPRQVLGAAALHKHHVVLLQAVALSRNKADSLMACAKPHTAALAVG